MSAHWLSRQNVVIVGCGGKACASFSCVNNTAGLASSSMAASRSCRVGRVQRHIRAARFQDSPACRRACPPNAFDAQAHQHVRSHALFAQVVRQPVGPGVEFGVGEPVRCLATPAATLSGVRAACASNSPWMRLRDRGSRCAVSFHSTSSCRRSASRSIGSASISQSGSATTALTSVAKCPAIRSMVLSSNKSVLYSNAQCRMSWRSTTVSVRSNLAVVPGRRQRLQAQPRQAR